MSEEDIRDTGIFTKAIATVRLVITREDEVSPNDKVGYRNGTKVNLR